MGDFRERNICLSHWRKLLVFLLIDQTADGCKSNTEAYDSIIGPDRM